MAVRPPLFVPFLPGIRLIPTLPAVVAHVAEAAMNIAETAKALAPVDEGDYRDGIEAIWGIEDGTAIGRVNANWFTSHWIEWGTNDTPTFAVITRAAEAAGYTFRGEGRSMNA